LKAEFEEQLADFHGQIGKQTPDAAEKIVKEANWKIREESKSSEACAFLESTPPAQDFLAELITHAEARCLIKTRPGLLAVILSMKSAVTFVAPHPDTRTQREQRNLADLPDDAVLDVEEVSDWLRVRPAWVRAHASGNRRPVLPSFKMGKFRRSSKAT
jgi:hypothetical protein